MLLDGGLTGSHRCRQWAAVLTLAALGIGAMAPSFGNRFTQDDLPLVQGNSTIHSLHQPGRFFTQSYWHDPFPPALYRPLATTSHALQWAAGSGHPRLFRWVSAVLLVATGLALYRVASLVLPGAGAWITAALFLVHPVHVEATALAVNQGELAVGLLFCLAVTGYLRARRQGPPSRTTTAAIALCYLLAMLFKENGLVLPGLLIAAELSVVHDSGPLRARVRHLAPLYIRLGLVAVLVVVLRTVVLDGQSLGTPTAEALAGGSLPVRALTMLGVVPHWLRLLFWPAELQADYSPREIERATSLDLAQVIGLALVAAWVAAVILLVRRRPAIGFALLWIPVALFPVSNVLVPTGIVLAERTLFGASAGAALLVGGLLSLGSPAASGKLGLGRVALVGVAILLAMGLWRSVTRSHAWRDQATLLRETVRDAPRSYAAHLAMARFLDDSGSAVAARRHFQEAARMDPGLAGRERALGDRFRLQGLCRPALRRYRLPLLVQPDPAVRASAVACLLNLARFDEARDLAESGVDDPLLKDFFRRAIRIADSALAREP